MRAPNHELLKAVKLAIAGEWNAAHELVQIFDNDPTAEWLHAVLHKIEGDQFNSRYWYQRASQLSHLADEPQAELAVIQAAIEAAKKDEPYWHRDA